MQLCLDGGGVDRQAAVSQCWKRDQKECELPSVELALEKVPQPQGLAAPSQACSQ